MINLNIIYNALKEEEEFFSNWKDDSWAQYVGWLLEKEDCNILVNRSNPAHPGTYDLTICTQGIHSASDPFGKNPQLYENTVKNLSLEQLNINYANIFTLS